MRRKRGLSICPIFNALEVAQRFIKLNSTLKKKEVDFQILKKKNEEGEILKKVSVDRVTKLKIDYCGICIYTKEKYKFNSTVKDETNKKLLNSYNRRL